MKTLTIKNPWALLICAGLKNVENRTWSTNFRGRILVHTSAKESGTLPQLLNPRQLSAIEDPFNYRIVKQIPTVNSAIIGEVDIIDCIQNSNSIWAEPGGYHWVLANPVLYQHPVFGVKGSLGLWNYAPHLYDGRMANSNATEDKNNTNQL